MPGAMVLPGGGGVSLAGSPPPPVADVAATGSSGSAARADHTHAGVQSLAALTGALGVVAGDGASLDTSAQNLRANISLAGQSQGDLISRGASSWGRLAVGASGHYLTSNGTVPQWTALPANVSSAGGLTGAVQVGAGDGAAITSDNGTNTLAANISVASQANGDMLVRAGGVWARLAPGASGQVLTSTGSAPQWGNATLPTGSAGTVYASNGTTNSFTAAPNIGGTLSVGGAEALSFAGNVITIGSGATAGVNLGGGQRNVAIAAGAVPSGVSGVVALGSASALPSGAPASTNAWLYGVSGNFYLDLAASKSFRVRANSVDALCLDSSNNTMYGYTYRGNVLRSAGSSNTALAWSGASLSVGHVSDVVDVTGSRLNLQPSNARNVSFFTNNALSSGSGVIGIFNCSAPPTTNTANMGILYVEGGFLKYRGTSGTVTTLGVA